MSSDEEDYMSDAFLSKKIEDVRPGIMKTQAQMRRFKIEQDRIEAKEKEVIERVSKREFESNVRNEGLAKELSHDSSKGFMLMQKMGYKKGMGLGKTDNAIKQPISIQLKNNRTGLGHETEKKRKSEQLILAHQALIIKRARMNDQLSDEFRDRKRELAIQKRIQSDLFRCQKTCIDLDMQKGLTQPIQIFYWPNYEEPIKEEDGNGPMNGDDNEPIKEGDGNGPMGDTEIDPRTAVTPPPSEIEVVDLEGSEQVDPDALDMNSKLFMLNMYLRDTHVYCPWCGIKFDNDDDMGLNCPGLTREEHDEEGM